jgi:hypothetical protein
MCDYLNPTFGHLAGHIYLSVLSQLFELLNFHFLNFH